MFILFLFSSQSLANAVQFIVWMEEYAEMNQMDTVVIAVLDSMENDVKVSLTSPMWWVGGGKPFHFASSYR